MLTLLFSRKPIGLRLLFNLNVAYMETIFNRKFAAERPAQIHNVRRKHAYAEQRLIMATDRYIAAGTADSKERARKWMHAWRAFRTSRHR
jgi:hypothetical protein